MGRGAEFPGHLKPHLSEPLNKSVFQSITAPPGDMVCLPRIQTSYWSHTDEADSSEFRPPWCALPIHHLTESSRSIRMVGRPARGPSGVWPVCGVSSIEPSGISSVQGDPVRATQSKVLPRMGLEAGASGVGLRLLLDGWFVNDSPAAVSRFATGTRRTQESY